MYCSIAKVVDNDGIKYVARYTSEYPSKLETDLVAVYKDPERKGITAMRNLFCQNGERFYILGAF